MYRIKSMLQQKACVSRANPRNPELGSHGSRSVVSGDSARGSIINTASALLFAGAVLLACMPLVGHTDAVAPDTATIEKLGIAESLSGQPGDAAEGRNIFVNRKLGNCLACHANGDLADQPFHGEVGPALDGVASRWNEAQLRLIVANAKKVFTDQTVMPGFYSLEVGQDVRKDLIGKTILSAQQVEDVVAYLATLK